MTSNMNFDERGDDSLVFSRFISALKNKGILTAKEFLNFRDNLAFIDTILGATAKPGMVFDYAGNTAPNGYLICNGQAISRITYSTLFSIIGTTYGSGNGSTTFNIPDLQTRVSIGVGNDYELGATGGEETHLLTEDELPAHSHRVNADAVVGDSASPTNNIPADAQGLDREYHSWPAATPTQMSINMIADTGGDEPHNNMQPYIVLNKIIFTGYFN